MCQIQHVFHSACSHWAPRPRLVGEPCVRALSHTSPCDYPFNIGAVTVATCCLSCMQRHRLYGRSNSSPASALLLSSSSTSTKDASDGEGSSGADDDCRCSSSTLSARTISTRSSSAGTMLSEGDSWQPFASLSDDAWASIQQARRRRRLSLQPRAGARSGGGGGDDGDDGGDGDEEAGRRIQGEHRDNTAVARSYGSTMAMFVGRGLAV